MADNIGVFISGDTRLTLKFEKFPQDVHAELLKRFNRLTEELEAEIKGDAPKGATGRLEDSIKGRVFDAQERITGSVAVTEDYAKAGALEYGAPGGRARPDIREHFARLGHVFGRLLDSPLRVLVHAHKARHLVLQARFFLRGPFGNMEERVEEELREAVDDAAQILQQGLERL